MKVEFEETKVDIPGGPFFQIPIGYPWPVNQSYSLSFFFFLFLLFFILIFCFFIYFGLIFLFAFWQEIFLLPKNKVPRDPLSKTAPTHSPQMGRSEHSMLPVACQEKRLPLPTWSCVEFALLERPVKTIAISSLTFFFFVLLYLFSLWHNFFIQVLLFKIFHSLPLTFLLFFLPLLFIKFMNLCELCKNVRSIIVKKSLYLRKYLYLYFKKTIEKILFSKHSTMCVHVNQQCYSLVSSQKIK